LDVDVLVFASFFGFAELSERAPVASVAGCSKTSEKLAATALLATTFTSAARGLMCAAR